MLLIISDGNKASSIKAKVTANVLKIKATNLKAKTMAYKLI